MKHTKEPWKVDGGECRNAIVPEFGQMAIAECWYRGNWENTRANASRIGRLRYSLVTSVKITPSLRSRLAASGGFR